MGRLSAAMLAELLKPVPEVFPLFSFTVGGTTYRYSSVGAAVAGQGIYEARVASWGGEVPLGVTLQDGGVDFPTLEILLEDKEEPHALTRLIEGPLRNQVRGALASIVLASRNVSSADWFTAMPCLIDNVGQPAPWAWSLTVGSRALPLRRESIPKARVTQADWPNSSVDVRGAYVPIIYGRISSANASNTGAVPTLYVDKVGFVYLLAAGWMKAVDAVYKDGTPVAAAGYSITHPVVNGRLYTCIDFTTDQGASVITADVQGYETVGDGTGTLITDPAAIAQHMLVNWIYGDYKTGSWLDPSTAPVDTASFATTFFSDRGYSYSVSVGTLRRGKDVLNDLMKSMGARSAWSAGKLTLKVLDWTSFTYVTDPRVLRENDLRGWKLAGAAADVIDSLEGRFALQPARGSYSQTLKVKDLGTNEQAPDTIELPYSGSFYL